MNINYNILANEGSEEKSNYTYYLVVKKRKLFKRACIVRKLRGYVFMKLTTVCILLIATFLLGVAANQAYATLKDAMSTTEYENSEEFPSQLYSGFTGKAIARNTPSDHIKESQIEVYKDRVIIDVQNAIWAKFTPTHSMDPVLSEKANAIEIVPKSKEEVNVGDIVAYKSEYADGIIIHRVINKAEDENGVYFTIKGDNNPEADPGKIRFSQIQSVVVGIIY